MSLDTLSASPDVPSQHKTNPLLSDVMILGYISLLPVVLHFLALQNYGYFRDELYYIACSQHLAWGFVDHPPLSILLLKLVRLILGDSLIALRILPALASGLTIFLTGLIAKELGGKTFSIILASITAIAPIGNFFLFNVYSMNFLDHLFWLFLIMILIRIISTGDTKLWLWFGIVAGLGLQNKISVLFLLFGIGVGILLTPQRKHLKSKYLWIGAVIAGLIFLPYILWNIAHQWPLLEFMHNAKVHKMSLVSPLEFFLQQWQYINQIAIVVLLPGLWFFFFSKSGRKYRLFGWVYLSIYILFTFQQAKAYYLAPIYPLLFAGGAVMIEQWLQKRKFRWPKPVIVTVILMATFIFAPVCLPILPVSQTIQWLKILGVHVQSGENHEKGVLPQHYADMFGWPEMTVKTARIYNSLTPQEQAQCLIYGTDYGIAGAIQFFGKQYQLPPVISGHNNYFFWPPTGLRGNVLISIGGDKEGFQRLFKQVEIVDNTQCQYAMPYENNKPIYLCKGLKVPLHTIWPTVKHYE